MKRIALLALIILGLNTAIADAQIINVPSEKASIQEGINAAYDGDTVLVDEGTYYENIYFKGKAITVASKFILDGDTAHISRTIIDGSSPVYPDSASTVNLFACKDTTSILKGFTITGGTGTKDLLPTTAFIRAGGGIVMDGGKIENNIVTGNNIKTAYYTGGGGIAVRPYDPNIKAIIRGNHVYNNSLESTEMAQGGGIYAWSEKGVIIVENNVITKNTVICTGSYKANAGGIMMGSAHPWEATLIVRNNLINENEIYCVASHGGGIFLTYSGLDDGKPTNTSGIQIYNNIIANNYSQERGGGIAIWDQTFSSYAVRNPSPLIYNNTIVGNKASEAGGIFNFNMYALLMNNIISNKSPSAIAPEISLEDINYKYGHLTNHGEFESFNNNIHGGWPGPGNIDQDPEVDSVDFTLSKTSPCIGKGIDSLQIDEHWFYAPVNDYYGNPRPNPFYNLVDMGAIEYNHLYFKEINVIVGEGTCNATIEVIVDGGTPPFTYYNDGIENEGNIFVDLCLDDYTISVKDDDGMTIDSSITVTVLGKSIVKAESLSLYPNPTQNFLTIDTDQPVYHSIEITSLNGQMIYSTSMEGNSKQIDLSPFSKGIYFITVRSKEFVRTEKIVKL